MTTNPLRYPMTVRKSLVTSLVLSLLVVASAPASLVNSGFESGTVGDADDWTEFGNAERSSQTAQTGTFSLKTFGQGNDSVSGAFQDVAALPGETWSFSGYGLTLAADQVSDGNYGKLRLEFLNSSFGLISAFDSATIIDSSSTTDTWIAMSVSGTAPAGTAYARVVPSFVDPADPVGGGGAVFFDDLTLRIVPEPAMLGLLVIGGWILRVVRRRSQR